MQCTWKAHEPSHVLILGNEEALFLPELPRVDLQRTLHGMTALRWSKPTKLRHHRKLSLRNAAYYTHLWVIFKHLKGLIGSAVKVGTTSAILSPALAKCIIFLGLLQQSSTIWLFLNKRHLFSHISGGQKSEDKVLSEPHDFWKL